MLNIFDIADIIGVSVEPYGNFCGKVEAINKPKAKLILVTAMSPTPQGEGKTTTSIGLADALNLAGYNTCLALREPSLGPCFGIKGGAIGGGKSKLFPPEKINLHFTGDFHALTSAHNLIAAVLDNHLYQGNALNIDVRLVQWSRCLDTNDRALRNVVVGLDYFARQSSFDITVASELMAVFCLANDFDDLRHRIDNIILAYDYNNKPITPRDLHITGSVLALLLDAFKPNLVQTLYETPAFVHGGPFANIAHGCNSIQATLTSLSVADFVVTEAGFASDLGAEKFLNIKSRFANLSPNCSVLVATSKAINLHGFDNLKKHIDNLHSFNLPVVVALNKFPTDSSQFIQNLKSFCESCGANYEETRI